MHCVHGEESGEESWRLWVVRAHPYKPRVGHPQGQVVGGVSWIEEHRLKPVLPDQKEKIWRLRLPGRTTPRKRPSGEREYSRMVRPWRRMRGSGSRTGISAWGG